MNTKIQTYRQRLPIFLRNLIIKEPKRWQDLFCHFAEGCREAITGIKQNSKCTSDTLAVELFICMACN